MKNSNTSTKHFENLSQVQLSTSNAIFTFHNVDGQSVENTKAAVSFISGCTEQI